MRQLTQEETKQIKDTLEYVLNVFSETCDCGKCSVCTIGTLSLSDSLQILKDAEIV